MNLPSRSQLNAALVRSERRRQLACGTQRGGITADFASNKSLDQVLRWAAQAPHGAPWRGQMAKAWRSVKKVKEYQNELLRWLTYTDDAHAGGPISPPHIGEYRAKQCSLKAAFAREQWHREWYEYGKSLRSNEHAAEFPELPPR